VWWLWLIFTVLITARFQGAFKFQRDDMIYGFVFEVLHHFSKVKMNDYRKKYFSPGALD